jgi:dCMP deaminase
MTPEKERKLFKDIVNRFATESHCESKKVAAIAVKNGRIIATGINGTPPGHINCDDYFRKYHKTFGINIPYEEWKKTPQWRELHHGWSNINELHAEQNLIAEACRNGTTLTDVDIYISITPCIACTKLLAALKPKAIYYDNEYDKAEPASKNLLESCGIKTKLI